MSTLYPLTLLYDASCPVCRLEMDELRHRDAIGRLVFLDISAPGFTLADHWPASASTSPPSLLDMNAALHGIGADGVVHTGVETIRLAYAAVGLGWFWAPTGWPVLRSLTDLGYRWFARHRYQISAHLAPLVRLVESRRGLAHRQSARERVERMERCHQGRCDM